jgi:hypothetical protein
MQEVCQVSRQHVWMCLQSKVTQNTFKMTSSGNRVRCRSVPARPHLLLLLLPPLLLSPPLQLLLLPKAFESSGAACYLHTPVIAQALASSSQLLLLLLLPTINYKVQGQPPLSGNRSLPPLPVLLGLSRHSAAQPAAAAAAAAAANH